MIDRNYNFICLFKSANILSIVLFLTSILFIIFKGLNFGIDFKGGTILEVKVANKNISISEIRSSVSQLNLGDVSVKEFGGKGNYLIKVEESNSEEENFIINLKKSISAKFNNEINFRRIEKVGPKVSTELLKSGIIAISLSLFAMLFYIWIRFEWQFSLGSIIALFHDVLITIGIFSLFSIEINLSIVAAVLTIVGYSMNDTVVIYDRIEKTCQNIINYTLTSYLIYQLMKLYQEL